MSAMPSSIELKDTPMRAANKANPVTIVQKLGWLIRRELWEHRSLYIAPIALGVLLIVLRFLPRNLAVGFSAASEGAKAADRIMMPYVGTSFLMFVVGLLLSIYFCVSSTGEHRDRTMLFWKSLPISDGMSIAAKALVVMLVVPIIVFVAAMATQLLILLISVGVVSAKGESLASYFERLEFAKLHTGFVYWLLTNSLWYAPIFALLMAISTFAKRAVAVWIVAPFLIGYAFDWFAGSRLFVEFVKHRLFGGLMTAFTSKVAKNPSDQLAPDPAKFFSTPDVWWGLLVAAMLIVVTVQLRKKRASE
jgi:ABC-2 type transport system permease protein